MKRTFKFDQEHQLMDPAVILARKNGDKLGRLPAVEFQLSMNMNDADEFSFTVYRETCQLDNGSYPLWDELSDLKLIWLQELDLWFEVAVELHEEESVFKTCTCTSLGQAELAQIELDGLEFNTDDDIDREDYVPAVLYNENKPEASLLTRLMKQAPHYKIKHVDTSLKDLQRTFTFSSSIQEALVDISTELDCLVVYNNGTGSDGKPERSISIYDLLPSCYECNERGDFTVCPSCGSSAIRPGYGEDTTIFVSMENLADSITIGTDVGSIKNCFRIEGGDELMNAAIRACNPNGTGYIWYLSEEMRSNMSPELQKKLSDYDKLYAETVENLSIDVSGDLLNSYNKLVDKYQERNKDLKNLTSPIVGYDKLMNAIYDTIDFYHYLNSTMMPTIPDNTTTAKDQIKKLTPNNIGTVAVQDLKACSSFTATSALTNYLKVIIDPNYKIDCTATSYENNTWKGTVTLTSYGDPTDTATSSALSIPYTDDYETFVRQKMDKVMAQSADVVGDITHIFKLDTDTEFTYQMTLYSASGLKIYSDCAQSVLDVLMEQGCSVEDHELHSLYTEYYRKKQVIDAEYQRRLAEIALIEGLYDSSGKLKEAGMQNILQDKKDEIQKTLNFEAFIGEELWAEFCSFRRDDVYSNDNFISDGLDNTGLFQKAAELLSVARQEIIRSANKVHTIDAPLKDLLRIEAFEPLLDHFDLGNWIRLEADREIYTLRIIHWETDFQSQLGVSFSDDVHTGTSVKDLQSILEQASSMSTTYDSVKKQASQGASASNRFRDWVDKGLDLTNTAIVKGANNQELIIDEHGLLARSYDEVTDAFDDRQLKIFNRGLYVTDDNWETTRAAIGNFVFWNPQTERMEEGYGVIANTLVGSLILGEQVGIYNESGSISLDHNGFKIQADQTLDERNQMNFTIERKYTNADGETVIDKQLYIDSEGNLVFNGGSVKIHVGDSSSSSSTTLDKVISDTSQVKEDLEKVKQLRVEIRANQSVLQIKDANGTFNPDYTQDVLILDPQIYYGDQLLPISAVSLTWYHNSDALVANEVVSDGALMIRHNFDKESVTYTLQASYQGKQGIETISVACLKNGADGVAVNGKDAYFHYMFADVASPLPSQMSKNPAKYFGFYTDHEVQDSNDPSDYTWTLFQGEDGIKGENAYLHIKYSDDGGKTFTANNGETPGKWMGTCSDENPNDPTSVSAYTWAKIVGKDGKEISSHKEYYMISAKSSGVLNTDAGFGENLLLPTEAKPYLWNYEEVLYSDGTSEKKEPAIISVFSKSIKSIKEFYLATGAMSVTTATNGWTEAVQTIDATKKYLWNYVRTDFSDGTFEETEPRIIGAYGDQGIAGTSSFFHIKYSDKENPTDSDMTETPSLYIGTCVDTNKQDPTSASAYTWSRFQGFNGKDGIGTPGKDGITHYLHIKYSNDGGKTFTDDEGEVTGTYMGTLVDTVQKDSTDPTQYTWAKITGDDGAPGKGISKVEEYYLASSSDSGVTSSTAGFDTVVPEINESKPYLWNYQTIVYTDGTTFTSPAVIISRYVKNGVGISDVKTYYLASSKNSGIQSNDTGFAPTVPTLNATNKYLWMTQEVTKTDGTKSRSTPAIISTFVENGKDGRGILTTEEYYLASASKSGVTNATAGFSKDLPTISKEKPYLWNYELIAYDDGTTQKGSARCIAIFTEDGRGIQSIDNYYLATPKKDGITSETPGFTTEVQNVTETNKYLWNYEKTTFTDGTFEKSDPAIICIFAKDGTNGRGITNVVDHYLASSKESGVKKTDTGWSTDVPPLTDTDKYLWNYETITFTDGSGYDSDPRLIGTLAKDGSNGRGIKTVDNYYLATSQTNITNASSGFTKNVQSVDKDHLYLWTYEQVTFDDNTTSKSPAAIIGTYSEDGKDGVSVSSIKEYYLATNSDSVTNSTQGFTEEMQQVSASKKYLWCYEIITYSNGVTSKTQARMIGTFSADGRGISSIVNYYLATNLSEVSETTSGWTTNVQQVSSNAKYLWNYEVTTYTDGTTDKSQPHIIGMYAKDGTNGRGVVKTEVQYYLSTSNTSITGGSWSTTVPPWKDGSYYWQKTVTTYTDGTTSESSAVCITGGKGETGNGIAKVTEEYYVSTSASSPTGGSWSETAPTNTDGKYVWTRSKIEYTDGTVSTTAEIRVTGETGAAGKGISSTSVTYQASADGSKAPTGTWSAGIPEVPAGHYLWTRTITTYTDNSTSTTYNVAYQGQNGTNGTNGTNGKGISTSVVDYQVGSSATTAPTGNWTSSVPNTPQGQYLWTRTTLTYTDGQKSVLYSVAHSGVNGTNGTNGTNGSDAMVIMITSSSGQTFKNTAIDTTLTAHVFKGNTELTASQISTYGTVKWYLNGGTSAVGTGLTLKVSGGSDAKRDYIAKLES